MIKKQLTEMEEIVTEKDKKRRSSVKFDTKDFLAATMRVFKKA